jgi:hypothetical protein
MEIVKTLEHCDGLFRLSVRADFDEDELAMVRRYGLQNCRLATGDASFGGRHHSSLNMRSAYRIQIGRIRGRWSPALVRTTGFTLIDVLSSLVGVMRGTIGMIVNGIVGRRMRLIDAIRGVTISSPKVTEVRESEMFILLSLASVGKALDYARGIGQDRIYSTEDLFGELDGLDFAGAGTELEKSRGKNLLVALVIVAVAAVMAMQTLGRQLTKTFAEQAAHEGTPDGLR